MILIWRDPLKRIAGLAAAVYPGEYCGVTIGTMA